MTAHHWLVLILLSLLFVTALWHLDATSDTRATKRRIRGWRRERLVLPTTNRRRT